MLYVIGFALAVVIIVIGLIAGGLVALVRPPEGGEYSDLEIALLFAVAVVAAVAGLVLLSAHGDGWWLLPCAAPVIAVAFVKSGAIDRRDRERESERRAAETAKQKAEQCKRDERRRVERLGKDGVAMLNRIHTAVARIAKTEAAHTGWLGDTADIDFSADRQLTETQLENIVNIRAMIAESKRLPDPTGDDRKMIKEAEAALKKLRGAVQQRIRVIEDCAKKAEMVDETLHTERRRAKTSQQRNELRGRLAAVLYGVQVTPDSPPSQSVDAVEARVAAFRELKDSIQPRHP